MELRHLRRFVILAEELHFARASDRLCPIQSALSRIIEGLEKELGKRTVNTPCESFVPPASMVPRFYYVYRGTSAGTTS